MACDASTASKSKAQENAACGDKNVNRLADPKPLGDRAYTIFEFNRRDLSH